jgi:hypothetical protein
VADPCVRLAARYGVEPEGCGRLLYHVTRTPNAELIRREGLQAGYLCAEGGQAACAAELRLAGEIEDEADWYGDVELSDNVRTREAFNELLDDARRRVRPDAPSHSAATFWWSTLLDAALTRNGMQQSTGERYRIVVADADRMPGPFWSGDYDQSSRLFDTCRDRLEECESCAGVVGIGFETEAEAERRCRRYDRLAERYYQDLRPWHGGPDQGREIICDCSAPPEAIRDVI